MRTLQCLDCGAEFPARTTHKASEFCSAKCRTNWQNRRIVRGCVLYDFFCEFRILRIGSLFPVICRIVSEWRREDVARRGGRRSWRHTKDWLEANPWIHSTATNIAIGARAKR